MFVRSAELESAIRIGLSCQFSRGSRTEVEQWLPPRSALSESRVTRPEQHRSSSDKTSKEYGHTSSKAGISKKRHELKGPARIRMLKRPLALKNRA